MSESEHTGFTPRLSDAAFDMPAITRDKTDLAADADDQKCPTFKLNNGYEIPAVGLGTWRAPAGQVETAVEFALTNGYRHIDCAHVYGNEGEVGMALGRALGKDGIPREDVFITSKLWNTQHAPEHVLPACQNSLTKLGLKYLDLYLVHWPVGLKYDKNNPNAIWNKDENGLPLYDHTPLEKTWEAMEKLVDLGMVKSIGLSNFNVSQIERILKVARHKPAVLQIESHPYLSQTELIGFCEKHRIVVTAYSPLGSAPVADKPHPLRDDDIRAIGDQYCKTAAQVCIRYQVDRGVAVIPKSVKTQRISANYNVFDFQLNANDLSKLDEMARTKRTRTCVPRITLPDGKVIMRDAKHPEFPFVGETEKL